MEVTLTLNVNPEGSMSDLQQLLDLAAKIEAGNYTDHWKTVAASSVTSSPPREAEVIRQIVASQAPAEAEVEESGNTVEETPAGTEAPVKRKGGRPTKAMIEERKAAAAAEQAKVNPATLAGAAADSHEAIPLSTGRRPPGVPGAAMVGSQQPQQPAMPAHVPAQVPEAGANIVSLEDLEACYNEARNHDPRGVFALMRAEAWASGEIKPRWFDIKNVNPNFYDRLYRELVALIPGSAAA